MIKKFVFVGPESSGKTTLCKILSEKYKTLWVREYCRVAAEEKITNIEEKKITNIEEKKITNIEEKKITNIEEEKITNIEEEKITNIEEKKITNIKKEKITNITDEINFNFTLDDFINMAHRQNQEEYDYSNKVNKILICDNDTFALTIWCERYLNKYYTEIYDIYNNANYLHNDKKIYILTKPNVEFVQDGFRDGEHIREWMYLRFIEELKLKKMKYYIIDSPDYKERLEMAINIINENIN
jgi:nicotinamide riboside kinase